jgi:hypothetical protein
VPRSRYQLTREATPAIDLDKQVSDAGPGHASFDGRRGAATVFGGLAANGDRARPRVGDRHGPTISASGPYIDVADGRSTHVREPIYGAARGRCWQPCAGWLGAGPGTRRCPVSADFSKSTGMTSEQRSEAHRR